MHSVETLTQARSERTHPPKSRRLSIPSRPSHWSAAILTAILLSLAFILLERGAPLALIGGALASGWAILAWRQPLPTFGALLFVWVTSYPRASLPIMQLESGVNRGGLMLGDLMWLIIVAVWSLKHAPTFLKHGIRLPARVDLPTTLLILYLLPSILLPLLGVLVWGHPISYLIPGLRYLQWVSFALLGYWLCRRYGIESVIQGVALAIAVAGVAHTLYALVQLFASTGVLTVHWLFFDHLFSERFETAFFFYPRATGWLANPNSYGLFGAVALVVLLATVLSGRPQSYGLRMALAISGVWAVAASTSRTALVGLAAALITIGIVWLLLSSSRTQKKRRLRLGSVVGSVLLATCLGGILWVVVPTDFLLARLAPLVGVALEGSRVDENALGRLENWDTALLMYEDSYRLGTWSPTGYVLDMPIDNHFVVLLVQGTPLYLGLFLALLAGIFWWGWRIALRAGQDRRWVGIALMGMTAMVFAASLTLSPLLESQVLAPFWTIVGMGLALKR